MNIPLSPFPAVAPSPSFRPLLPLAIALSLAAGAEAFTSSAVSIALPRIAADFAASPDEISWAVTLYLAAYAVVLPLTAWLSDAFGQKNYLAISAGTYALAAVGCVVTGSLPGFLIWRVVQGAAGAAFVARALFTFTKELRPPVLARALYVLIAGFSLKALGLPVGGYLVDSLSWRWLFAVPAIVLLFGALPALALSREIWPRQTRPEPNFLGLTLLVVGLGALAVLLIRGERDEWFASPAIIALTLTALITLPLFAWQQSRSPALQRLISPETLRYRSMGTSIFLSFLAGVMAIGGLYVLPQFLLGIVRCDAYRAGWLLSLDAWALMAGLALAATVLMRLLTRSLLVLSGALYTASMLLLASRITSETPVEALYLPIVLHGVGFGLALPPIGIFAFRAIGGRHAHNGEARALHAAARQLGGIVAVAAAVVLLDGRATAHSGRLEENITALNPAVAQTLTAIGRGLVSRGLAPATAEPAAQVVLARLVGREAAVLAFRDLFIVTATVGIAVSALAFRLPKLRGARRSTFAVPTPPPIFHNKPMLASPLP